MAATETKSTCDAPPAMSGHPSTTPRKREKRNDPYLVRQVPGGWITCRRWFRTEWEAIKYQTERNGPPKKIEALELRPLPFGPEDCIGAGWVYFIQSERGGPIKIGVATNVRARIDSLQSGNWEKFIILGVMSGTYKHENILHRHFAQHRLFGEWFADSIEIRNAIGVLCAAPEKSPAAG